MERNCIVASFSASIFVLSEFALNEALVTTYGESFRYSIYRKVLSQFIDFYQNIVLRITLSIINFVKKNPKWGF